MSMAIFALLNQMLEQESRNLFTGFFFSKSKLMLSIVMEDLCCRSKATFACAGEEAFPSRSPG